MMTTCPLIPVKIPNSHEVCLGATAKSPGRYLASTALAAVDDVFERPHGIRSEYTNTGGEEEHDRHPATET